MLSIDLGWNSIKLAAMIAGCATPQALKLAANASDTIPLQAYIPKSGPIRVGAIAQNFIHHDPAGSIGDVGAILSQGGHIFRNGRRISIRDIAAAFFHHIRDSLSREYVVEHCVITSTLNPWAENGHQLVAAARLGGFSRVDWLPTAISIAKFARNQLFLQDDLYAILDIGAGHSKLSFVEFTGDELTQLPEWPPRYSIGVRIFESIVYDLLRAQIRKPLEDAKHFHILREKILQLKHDLHQAIQHDAFHEIIIGRENLRLSTAELIRCNRQCLTDCLQLISQVTHARDPHGSEPIGLLVAGGGAKMPGLSDAIRAEGWGLPIHLLESPEYACVIGAALENTPIRSRSPDNSNDVLAPSERQSDRLTSTTSATKRTQCPDRICQTWNDSNRLYCYRCGMPLNDILST